MRKQIDEEDDGRVIADMGTVHKRSFLLPEAMTDRSRNEKPEYLIPNQKQTAGDDLTKEESRWYILGALKAGFLIWLAYAVGFGLFLLLITLLSRH